MRGSYVRYVAAALVVLAIVMPLAATAAANAETIAIAGRGVVFTNTTGVGGLVAFFFNLTKWSWTGPSTYIYLSANGNPVLTLGDTPIAGPFPTTSVAYVTGNITITAADVLNFIRNLRGNQSNSAAVGALAVLNHLEQYGWAEVYLKIATGTPTSAYTVQAIAAGPFNLTLLPAFSVVVSYGNYMSFHNCTLNANKYGVRTYYEQDVNLTLNGNFPEVLLEKINAGKYNYTIVASYSSMELSSIPVTVYKNYSTTYSSEVFQSLTFVINMTSRTLALMKADLKPNFVPPVLTEVGSTPLYGFDMNAWSLIVNGSKAVSESSIEVPPPPSGLETAVFDGGSEPYAYSTTYVYTTNITYDYTNVDGTGLLSSPPSTSYQGFVDVLPSFTFYENTMATGVAGPAGELNPGDIVNVTFADMPAKSVLTSLEAAGNESLLPTEPIAAFEWNEGEWTLLSKFFLTGNMTNLTGYIYGDTIYNAVTGAPAPSLALVVPNAPYGLPFSYLGLYPTFSYVAQLTTGNVTMTASVYGSANETCHSSYEVYPFMQIFASNANGQFFYPTTTNYLLLLGNYILVRGFGFPAGGYGNLTFTYDTSYSAQAAPLPGTLNTDKYGDFVYITQVPYKGSFAAAVVSYATSQCTTGACTVGVPISISSPSGVGLNESSYLIWVPVRDPMYTLVYVQPAPTTWDNTTYTLPRTETPASIPVTYSSVPTNSSSSVTYLPNIYGAIEMPAYLVRFPYEATQYIVNGTSPLIPEWQGGLEDVVVAGAPVSSPMDLVAVFELEGTPYNAVNLSALPSSDYAVPFTNGYAEIKFLPVPDLFGTVELYPDYYYLVYLKNVSNGITSEEPAYSEVFVATAAEVLVEPASFDFATMIVNYTSSSNPLGLPTLYMNVTVRYEIPTATGTKTYNSTEFIYEWPPYAAVQYLLLLPGAELKYYLFGAPLFISGQQQYPTYPTQSPVQTDVEVHCGGTFYYVPVGYLINGTLWSTSPSGQLVKGGVLNPVESLCYTGTYDTSFPYIYGESLEPVRNLNATVYYIAPNQVPAEPVAVSVVGSGSTVNAGEPYVVLVPTQVPVFGLQPKYAQYFFKVSGPSLQAYVLDGGALVPVPSASIASVGTINGYEAYEITLPPNVTEGQLVVIVSEEATYIFSGQTYTGTAAAEMGIVPPVNTSSITSSISNAISEAESAILANLTKQLAALEGSLASVNSTIATYYHNLNSAMGAYYGQLNSTLGSIVSSISSLSSDLATYYSNLLAELGKMNSYMAGNFSAVESAVKELGSQVYSSYQSISSTLSSISSSISSLNATVETYSGAIIGKLNNINSYMAGNFSSLSSQIQAAKEALSSYMAGNFSSLETALSSISSALSSLSSQVTTAQETLSGYMAGNFSAVNSTLSNIESSISSSTNSIEGLITNVGGEVGTIGATVDNMEGTVDSIYTAVSAIYTTLNKLNSTLTTIESSLSSAAASLSGIAGEVSTIYSDVTSMSSTLSSVSSTLGSVSSTLGSVSSTLGTVSSDLSSIKSQLSSMSSTLSSVSSTLSGVSSGVSSAGATASAAYSEASIAVSEAHAAASNAATAATYALGALIVAIIALALVAYVAFAKL